MALDEKSTDEIIKKPFVEVESTPQPHFIPGYTGFCPDLPMMVGASYARVTNEILRQRPEIASRLRPTDAKRDDPEKVHEAEVKQMNKESLINSRFPAADRRVLSDYIMPGYGGHVPNKSDAVGVTFSKGCVRSISKFLQQQAERRKVRGVGIGRLLTLRLAKAGANVLAVSRTQSDLDALKKENPTKIQTLCLDIGNWEATKQALKSIGPVDMLVNNAGIMDVKDFGELTEEEVDRTLNINVKAIINITQMIANDMKSRGKGGAIVNLSSALGLYAVPSYGVYCGSKGAVHQLTRTMAAEFGPHKIRVNSVNPTVVRTRMTEKEGFFQSGNEYAKVMMGRTPLRRFAEPDDIVGPILFLLSDYASMITGVALPIDGGLTVCYT